MSEGSKSSLMCVRVCGFLFPAAVCDEERMTGDVLVWNFCELETSEEPDDCV